MHPKQYQNFVEASGKPVSRSPGPPERASESSPASPPHSRAPPGRYLRAPEAAKYLGLSASTLAKMRLRGDGPIYSKAGPRVVVYARANLESWLAARERRSTSDDGGESLSPT